MQACISKISDILQYLHGRPELVLHAMSQLVVFAFVGARFHTPPCNTSNYNPIQQLLSTLQL